MTTHARCILALFVMARRRYQGMTPSRLAQKLGVNSRQIHAVENHRAIKHQDAEKLAIWCGLVWDSENWVEGRELP